MKVLMTRMAPRIGGAEIYNLNLTEGFKKYFPSDQIFFITNLLDFGKKIEFGGAKTFILPVFSEEVGTKRGLIRLIFSLPKYLFYFLKTILFLKIKRGVKLVVFQGTTEKIVLTPLLKILKFKLIWLEHGPVFEFPKAKEVLFLYEIMSRFADEIITVSDDAQKDLINNGISSQKVVCIHTGIDTEYFFPLKDVKENLVIGYVGAICQEKGIEDFLKVGEIITHRLKDVKLILVGQGPMIHKRENFIFSGFKKDIRPYLRTFDIFFYPTQHLEGISLAVLEAMAMEIPVVTRDIGGNRELVIHGKTGCLFKNETPEGLADLIIRLLMDERKRKMMGKLARERIVKYFNLKKWVMEIHQTFEEVTSE